MLKKFQNEFTMIYQAWKKVYWQVHFQRHSIVKNYMN